MSFYGFTSHHDVIMSEEKQQSTSKRRDRWFLLVVFFIFLFGFVVRGYSYVTQPESVSRSFQQQTTSNYAQKAFPGQSGGGTQSPEVISSPGEQDLLFQVAPYLTEGGLSFFIGFCIGYVLRLVAKTAMLLIGTLYMCLIVLSHYGMITVDWGSFQQVLQQVLLNAQTHAGGLRGMIVVTLPSAVMGGLGIWRGFKKT